uniref:Putative secreted protein n=1 Tax=Ixodes scapularis TaxID=6945 RepID=A0A4D5S1L7_IXOSC
MHTAEVRRSKGPPFFFSFSLFFFLSLRCSRLCQGTLPAPALFLPRPDQTASLPHIGRVCSLPNFTFRFFFFSSLLHCMFV